MSIIQRLLELQVNGQSVEDEEDNFDIDETMDEDGEAPAGNPAADPAPEVEEPDNPEDEEDDFTLDDDDDGNIDDTQGPVESDEEDDFTLDDEVEPTSNNEEEQNSDSGENNKEDTGGNVRDISTEPAIDGGANAESSDENGGDDDFTMDGSDDTGEESSSNNDTPAEEKSSNKEAAPSDPTDAIDDDEKRAAEEAIYDSLTDDQKRVRILQLKLDYRDLYETMTNAIEGINNIPKNINNLETIKRLNILLTKAKSILISYINHNFDLNTYLENYSTYLKYIAIFRTTSRVIEELNENSK